MKYINTLVSSIFLSLVALETSGFAAHQATECCRNANGITRESKANPNAVLPVYSHRIDSINLKYENSLLGGTITLDNGYVLKIVDYKTRDDNAMTLWQQGDDLWFEAESNDNQLVMAVTNQQDKDKYKAQPYVIFDLLDSSNKGPKVVNVSQDGEYVKLSDGTVWQFGWWNKLSTKHWAAGQRVIVQGHGDKNDYRFINVDMTPDFINYDKASGSYVLQ
jgi:hypothetical protein